MGNQHEIIQTKPRSSSHGVIVKIRKGQFDYLNKIKLRLAEHYIYPIQSNGNKTIPNLDAEDIHITEKGQYLCIQSGGKMWCGYENFKNLVKEISYYIENTTFYIGDEEDFIDKFEIIEGELFYKRCHSGYYIDLESFLNEKIK